MGCGHRGTGLLRGERDVHFSVARERGDRMCAGRVCASMGFHVYHGTMGLSRESLTKPRGKPQGMPWVLFTSFLLNLYFLQPEWVLRATLDEKIGHTLVPGIGQVSVNTKHTVYILLPER